MILGGGPNRIGQGIEFDYCCVHAAFALEGGRLRDHHGQLQSGDGQHRLRHLRQALLRAADARGRARHRRAREAGRGDRAVRRPDAAEAGGAARSERGCRSSAPRPTRSIAPRTASASRRCSTRSSFGSRRTAPRSTSSEAVGDRARASATRCWCGRPTCSAGARWRSSTTSQALRRYMDAAVEIGPGRPVLIDQFLEDAIEVDVDAICDGETVVIGGIMEHIERAGVHSGDSACSLPPKSVPAGGPRRGASTGRWRWRSSSASSV